MSLAKDKLSYWKTLTIPEECNNTFSYVLDQEILTGHSVISSFHLNAPTETGFKQVLRNILK